MDEYGQGLVQRNLCLALCLFGQVGCWEVRIVDLVDARVLRALLDQFLGARVLFGQFLGFGGRARVACAFRSCKLACQRHQHQVQCVYGLSCCFFGHGIDTACYYYSNMQHATCNMQHATSCNMQHATCTSNMQHATCNIPTCNTQHSLHIHAAYQHATCNM